MRPFPTRHLARAIAIAAAGAPARPLACHVGSPSPVA
jgi:hypothetical protein